MRLVEREIKRGRRKEYDSVRECNRKAEDTQTLSLI